MAGIPKSDEYGSNKIAVVQSVCKAYIRSQRIKNSHKQLFDWRRDRDSNPGYVAVHSRSKTARSTTLTSLHINKFVLQRKNYKFSVVVDAERRPKCEPISVNLTVSAGYCLHSDISAYKKFYLITLF